MTVILEENENYYEMKILQSNFDFLEFLCISLKIKQKIYENQGEFRGENILWSIVGTLMALQRDESYFDEPFQK